MGAGGGGGEGAHAAPRGSCPSPLPPPARPTPAAGRVYAGRDCRGRLTRAEGERQQKIKKEQMTSFSGRLRPTWTNFLGTVVEQLGCRWKHLKLNQIKTRKFSALPEPSKGRLVVREPWVFREEGRVPPPPPGLGFQHTSPPPHSDSLYPERVSSCPKVTQPVFILLRHPQGQTRQRLGNESQWLDWEPWNRVRLSWRPSKGR